VPEKTLLKTAAYMFDVHLGGISYVSRHIDHFFQFFFFHIIPNPGIPFQNIPGWLVMWRF